MAPEVSSASSPALAASGFRARGGRYLLTGRVPCSGIRSMPPRSATSFETAECGSARSPKWPVRLVQRLVVDAVDAQRAFLHDAGGEIHLARTIGAGPGTQAAADAHILVHQHDAVVGALVGGAGGADGDTGRLLAMQAGFREMHDARLARLADDLPALRYHLEGMHAVEPSAGNIRAIGVLVGKGGAVAAGVPFLAVDHAGMATDAGVEVDDEAELFRCGKRGKRGHGQEPPPLTPPHKGEGKPAPQPLVAQVFRSGLQPRCSPSPLWGGVRGGGPQKKQSTFIAPTPARSAVRPGVAPVPAARWPAGAAGW